MNPKRIISGGQTGADRAGLDFALKHGIPCGGWCPKGRLSEDGSIPERYPFVETTSAEYPERTQRNVEDADATVIFDASGSSRGTKLAVKCCQRAKRPYRVLTGFPDIDADARALADFLASEPISVLNIAGNRESGSPGMHQHVLNVLEKLKTSPSA